MHGADERLAKIHIVAFATALMFWERADVLGVLTSFHLTIWVHGVRYLGLGFIKTSLDFGRYFSDYRCIPQIYAVQSEPD